jgi:hypothetical protein
MFAVKHTTSGKYFRRRNRWQNGDSFEDNLNDAELYRSRGAALNSAGFCKRIGTTAEGFALYDRHRTLPPNLEIVEVTVTQTETPSANRVAGLYLLHSREVSEYLVQDYCLAEYVPDQFFCWLFDNGNGSVESFADEEITRVFTVEKLVLTDPLT